MFWVSNAEPGPIEDGGGGGDGTSPPTLPSLRLHHLHPDPNTLPEVPGRRPGDTQWQKDAPNGRAV